MRGENVPINGPMLLEKANSLAIQLNFDFQPNPLWLERLKKQENISFQKLHGEKRAADTEGAKSWTLQISPSIVEGAMFRRYDGPGDLRRNIRRSSTSR